MKNIKNVSNEIRIGKKLGNDEFIEEAMARSPRASLLLGTILGLIMGIVGNLFVELIFKDWMNNLYYLFAFVGSIILLIGNGYYFLRLARRYAMEDAQRQKRKEDDKKEPFEKTSEETSDNAIKKPFNETIELSKVRILENHLQGNINAMHSMVLGIYVGLTVSSVSLAFQIMNLGLQIALQIIEHI